MQGQPVVVGSVENCLQNKHTRIGHIKESTKYVLHGGRQEFVHVGHHGHESTRTEAYYEVASDYAMHILSLDYLPVANGLNSQRCNEYPLPPHLI